MRTWFCRKGGSHRSQLVGRWFASVGDKFLLGRRAAVGTLLGVGFPSTCRADVGGVSYIAERRAAVWAFLRSRLELRAAVAALLIR